MRIDDFLVLGRTVPEDSQHYGMRVCMAGYSAEVGRLLRVYPLTIDNPLRTRHQAILDVQRNANDNRQESFKLRDAVSGIQSVSSQPVLSTADVGALAATLATPSIAALNAQWASLGIVPIIGRPQLVWKQRQQCSMGGQQELFDEFVHDLTVNQFLRPSNYPAVPYLQFRDQDGLHCLQLREWGCFEYLRKHDFQAQGLDSALGIASKEPMTFQALVGNMAHRRNVWLVINLFRQETLQPLPLFPATHESGRPTHA